MFNFGNKPATTAAPAAPAVPSLSFTSATPQLGSTAQQPTNSFSFGAPQTSAPAAGASGSTGSSLFGNTAANAQPAAPASGSLFGSTQQSGTGSTGGLFGNTSTSTQPASTTTTGGGLFGGGGGLFGAKPAAPATTGAAGTTGTAGFGTSSLFGGQQQQQPAQTGLGTTSLFGQNNQQQQQPQQSSNLFGQSTSQPLFGSQAAQNTVQQPTASQGGMQGSTRFTDLPESHQKVFEDLNLFIKTQKEKANGTDTIKVGAAIKQTNADAQSGYRETLILGQSHKAIAEAIKKQIVKNKEAEATLITIMTLVDAASKSTDGRHNIIRPNVDRDFPTSFFVKTAAQLEDRVQRYKTSISQLRRAIDALVSSTDGPSPEAVGQTIQNHQNAIITLAGQIEHLDTRLNACRAGFTAVFQELNHTARDPFEMERERQGEPPRIR